MRFIGFMDVGTINGWRLDEVLPADEILVRISREFLPCSSEPKPNHVGEAAKHGKLYTCLFRRSPSAGRCGGVRRMACDRPCTD
jgi:molybdenum cofactor biosynthesis enzyme MoaA